MDLGGLYPILYPILCKFQLCEGFSMLGTNLDKPVETYAYIGFEDMAQMVKALVICRPGDKV